MAVSLNVIVAARNLPLFHSLSTAEYRSVIRYFHHGDLPKGRVLLRQGDQVPRLHIILHGAVQQMRRLPNGDTVSLRILSEGDIVALPELVLGEPALADCQLIEPTGLLYTDVQVYHTIIAKLLVMADFLNTYLSSQYVNTCRKLTVKSPFHRFLRYLLELSKVDGPLLSVTNDQIAEATGVARQTVNRYLDRLRTRGLLTTTRGSVEILDSAALARAAQDTLGF